MDLYKILQLVKRHLFLLLIIPIIMAVLVFLFTRNQPKSYSSETKVYTGIATGYSMTSIERRSLDYASTNIKFEDLLITINSNNNISNTAIQLLAQDLILEAPIPQYISRDNYYNLQKIVPKKVKDLVVKNGKMGLEREKEDEILRKQEEIDALEKEIQKKKRDNNSSNNTIKSTQTYNESINVKTHTVRPGESLYSIAAMYNVDAGELMDKNNLNNNAVSNGQVLIIRKSAPTSYLYHIVKNGENLFNIAKYYNISIIDIRRLNKLYSDKVDVGTRLIIRDMTNNSSNLLNEDNSGSDYVKFSETINLTEELSPVVFKKDPILPKGIRLEDYKATVANLTKLYNSSDSNFVYELLHYAQHKHYSIEKIKANLQVNRLNNSDHVRVRYQSNDPGICQQTLKILTKEFIFNYKFLHSTQTNAVVNEMKKRLDASAKKLATAEDELLKFNIKNNIINYYEQSKYTAEKKEDLDLLYSNKQIEAAAAQASIDALETKLMAKDSIYVKSDIINKIMKDLSRVKELIIINELDTENDPHIGNDLINLKLEAKRLKDKMKFQVDQLSLYTHSSEGIPIKDLLKQYLDDNIAFVEARASLGVLRRRRQDFTIQYKIFAPLGAKLKKIDREIDVAEKEYLGNLHAYNQAKLKQQNNLLASNIKVVDEPSFPLLANPSKNKLLILAAAVIGFLIVAFVILMLEFFDTTIKNTESVEKQTNLKLAGAFPILEPGVNTKYIKNRLIELILQNIKMYLNHNSVYTSEKPYLVLIFSTQREVGKTLIATELINKLRSWGEKVLYLNYELDGNDDSNTNDLDSSINYTIDNRFVEIKNINELLASKYLREDNYKYDYIFLEIPALIYNSYPLELMNSVDVSLMVTKATNHWRKADITALEIMEEVSREKPMVILNQIELFALEDIINDIPENKNRSIRRRVKKVITYPFRLKVRVRVD